MSNSLFLGTVNAKLINSAENLSVNVNDCSGNAIKADGSGNLNVFVSNPPSFIFAESGSLQVAVENLNLDANNNVGVLIQNASSLTVADSAVATNTGNINTALNNQRQSKSAWSETSVAQNGVSASIYPAGICYTNTALSVYGTSSGCCTLCVQLSNDDETFYSSQYTYTVNGDFGFCIAGCSASSIRLIMTSTTTTTITAFLNTC